MTPSEFDVFLLSVMGVCALGAVLNVLNFKRRGTSALMLAAAFVALGITVQLYRIGVPKALFGAGIFLVVAILVADFCLRAVRQESRK